MRDKAQYLKLTLMKKKKLLKVKNANNFSNYSLNT